jgi:hypothetical protein
MIYFGVGSPLVFDMEVDSLSTVTGILLQGIGRPLFR